MLYGLTVAAETQLGAIDFAVALAETSRFCDRSEPRHPVPIAVLWGPSDPAQRHRRHSPRRSQDQVQDPQQANRWHAHAVRAEAQRQWQESKRHVPHEEQEHGR